MAAPRVVAELGRPETPEETAARKAENSRIHRQSRTVRNLIAAMLATLAVVVVLVLAVPRGDVPPSSTIDVASVARQLTQADGVDRVVADVPDSWRVNAAAMQGDDVAEWAVVYVPNADAGFVRVTQGIDADPGWVSRELGGTASDGTVTISGIDWQRYEPSDPSAVGNVSYALATSAGADTIIVSGATDAATAAIAASGLAPDILQLRKAAG